MRLTNVILVFLLWFAGLTAAAQFAKIAVPFELVQAHYPQYNTELGWMLSLISLVGAVLGIIGGTLVGRFGPKRVLIYGMVIGAALSFWQANMPGLTTMLISRVVEGLSHLAIVVAAPTLIAQLSSDRFRGAAMTLWGTFFGVAFVLVAMFVEFYLPVGNLSRLFVIHGGVMLILALLLAASLPSDHGNATGGQEMDVAFVVLQHKESYRSPFISAPGVGWLFYTFTFVSLLTILPQLVADNLSAYLAGLMPLVSIAGSMILVPLMLQVMSGIMVTMLGFVSGIAVVIWALLGGDIVLVGITLFAVLGLVQGATFAAIPELNSDMTSQALSYGVMAQTGNIGNLVGTPVLLVVLGYGGQAAMFAAVVAAYVLALFAHGILQQRRRLISHTEQGL